MKSSIKYEVYFKKFQLLFFIIIFPFVVCAQLPKWTQYTVASTSTQLCNNHVTTIAIDSHGNKWIGTIKGISKFDNNKWTNFTSTFDGLISDYVTSSATDIDGSQWFVTGKGVLKFDGSHWTTYTKANGLIDNNVCSIAIDNQGNKWFGTYAGISKFDGIHWTTYYTQGYDQYVSCISIDKQGNKWFGTFKGVSKFDGTTWVNYSTTDGLVSNNVSSIAIDPQGNKWFGTDKGISKFDGVNWTTYNCINSPLVSCIVNAIAIDLKGSKWFATNAGISKFDGLQWINYTKSNGLVNNKVFTLAIDTMDNKWFGTDNGVSKFDNTTWTNYKTTGLVYDDLRSVATDDLGNKWFGTYYTFYPDSGGVSKFDGNHWTTYKDGIGSLSGNEVYAIVNDEQNNLWFGTDHGLSKLADTGWKNYKSIDSIVVQAIAIDLNGDKWLGSWLEGLYKFNDSNLVNYKKSDGLIDNLIDVIAIDRHGNKWIGTSVGLSKFDGSKWTTYTTANGLIDNKINSIAIDAEGNKWFGTDHGVSMFDNSNWTSYKDNGLNQSVTTVAIDAYNNKWFGTKLGLTKFDGVSYKAYLFKNMEDTIMYNSFSIDNEGVKWIATSGHGVIELEDGGPGPLKQANLLVGAVFEDLNGNGIKDSDEVNLPEQVVNIDNDNFVISQGKGYFYSSLKKGVHQIKYIPRNYWQLTTDSVLKITIDNITKNDTVFFGVKSLMNLNDVSIDMTGTTSRAGFTSQYWIDYKNKGTITQNGRVIVKLDSHIKVLNTVPVADSITANIIVWNFSDLKSQEHRQLYLYTQMPGITYFGDTLVSNATIISGNADITLKDNSDTIKQVLTGSRDPNDKLVTPEGIGVNKFTPMNTPLTYTIRFQNTGTDTAFNVNIRDTLNTNLDLNMIKIIASSYPVSLELRAQNEAIFHFENIMLPDSIENQTGSNGFVKYSISPKANLPENSIVTNKAYIYFDFNPPVATNEVKNTYVSTLQPLLVSTGTLIIAAVAKSTATFNITSNINWTATSDQNWLTLSNASGTGNATITLTGLANPTTASRTATVTISGSGVSSQTITVIQNGIVSMMSMTTTEPIGSVMSFSLQANAANTPVKIDFGDGTLVNKTIGISGTNITGALVGSQTIKIYGSGITYLSCYNDQLTALDVSQNAALTMLICSYNGLTILDLSGNNALTYLNCSNNLLSTLDVTRNNQLTLLKCSYNQLSSLDITANLVLTTLDCSNNQFTSLNVTKNVGLTSLYCSYNQLSTLDVNKNHELSAFSCNNNQLTNLDVTSNTALTFLDCRNNGLLFNTLPLKQATWTTYTYAPQSPIEIVKDLDIQTEIDLSSQNVVQYNATKYTWKTKAGNALVMGTDCSVENGKTVFLKPMSDSVYCEMTNTVFPYFTGSNVLKTTNTGVMLNTSTENLNTIGVKIYTYHKTLYINLSFNAQLTLFDMSGRQILSKAMNSGSNEMQLQYGGIYLVKITSKNGIVIRKVYVE